MRVFPKSALVVGVFLSAGLMGGCGGAPSTSTPAAPAPGAAAAIPAAAGQYTCEMHPEVVSDKPGDCPKCKMPLTKKKT